uniref:protein BIC1-like n=1 Tax=Erigeron canadensis TaxID=72917 RepID=UPI001CB88C10|nr:protein BIC1-like [Erigeron canadensis]
MTNYQEQQQKQEKDQEVLCSMDKSLKNPNIDLPLLPLSSSQDFETSRHQHNIMHSANETHEVQGIITKNENHEGIKMLENPEQLNTLKDGPGNSDICSPYISYTLKDDPVNNQVSFSPIVVGEEDKTKLLPSSQQEAPMVEESGRERLKRHRENMAGRVWIPDIWGHEDLLKDWIDCTVFDSSLGNKTILSARAALVQEGRSTLRIHNQC